MRKSLKIIVLIIVSLFLCVVVDLVSIYTRNKPIFAIKDSDNSYYYGLFYDTYNCSFFSVPQIKFKGSKFTCSNNVKNLKQYAYTIETSEMIGCNKEKNLYISRENQNIYTYCLNSISINDGNQVIELKNYYRRNTEVIDEIINTLSFIDTYEDGGSKLYRDNGNTGFTNHGLAIIKCNTIEGNQDIYIGPLKMKYESTFCEYDENMKEF